MPRKVKSIESRIAKHEKYRRQCKVRIRPCFTLSLFALSFAAFIVWLKPEGWWLAIPLVGFPILFTSLEVFGYYSHDRAIKQLRGGA